MTINDVEYTVKIKDEHVPFVGNVCASGDDEHDAECEDWVRSELAAGNLAAWCYVEVTATLDSFHGSAGVGGCSYRSEAEIHEQVVPDLKSEALADLVSVMHAAQERSRMAREFLADGSLESEMLT